MKKENITYIVHLFLILIVGGLIGMFIQTNYGNIIFKNNQENNEIVFIVPDINNETMNEYSFIIGEYAKEIKYDYRFVKFDSEFTDPGIFLINKDYMSNIAPINKKKDIEIYLCQLTNNKDICDKAQPIIPKKIFPQVDLFVMSYCPYGLQVERSYLELMDFFQDKASLKIKFVDYIMHGEIELREELRQYCIQKEQPMIYKKYLECFIKSANSKYCKDFAEVNLIKLGKCWNETEEEFNTLDLYYNKSTWLYGQYPIINIDKKDVEKYEVKGSPSLVINGINVKFGRSIDEMKEKICEGFEIKPEICYDLLNKDIPKIGFDN